MRIPLAVDLDSRDGTVDQDALIINGVPELVSANAPARVRKRAGVTTAGSQTDKLALLTATSRSYITDSSGSVAMGDPSYGTVYGISIDEGESGATVGDYYTWNGTSWTRTGAMAPANLTYTFGCAQIDGYFCILSSSGQLHTTTAANNPTAWSLTSYVSLPPDGSSGAAVTRYLDYIIGFTATSMQPFYNAGNPTGSILSPIRSGLAQVGCLKGRSIASNRQSMFWLGQEKESGKGVYRMTNLSVERISTPAVDRIIAADDYATVYGTCCTAGGHDFYLLTLVTSNLTLAYHIASGTWAIWKKYTAASNKTVSTITRSGTTATVTTSTAHGLSDGDPVTIAGADQAGYNGLFQVSYVSSTSFEVEVSGSPATPATGTITATPYTAGYFPYVRYVGSGNPSGSMLSTTGTTWYKFSDTTYKDDGLPIDFFVRTARIDMGTRDRKRMARISVIGDSVGETAMVRWSDDDSASFTAYRRITLSDEVPNIRRCGGFERRSIEFRHIGNTAPSIDALELDVKR